jgi:hypothetical protein
VTEVSADGQVPELLFANDGGAVVLLLDGEELAGGKQNRVVNVTILAPARQSIRIPVSCVERGRWRATSAECSTTGSTLFSGARAAKNRQVTESYRRHGRASSDQAAIWSDIDRTSATLGVPSSTSAMADVYAGRQVELKEYVGAFRVSPGQVGAVFGVGRLIGLECFDHPATFAALFPKILRGYALDALEGSASSPVTHESLERFLADLGTAASLEVPSVGLGRTLRFNEQGITGGVLVDGERVLHVMAYGEVA